MLPQEKASEAERYVASLYFAVSTVATVGFGELCALLVDCIPRAWWARCQSLLPIEILDV